MRVMISAGCSRSALQVSSHWYALVNAGVTLGIAHDGAADAVCELWRFVIDLYIVRGRSSLEHFGANGHASPAREDARS